MKIGAPDSIKFKKLKMKLRIPHWQAVGLLESLWLFTSRNSPRGDIGKHCDEDIAAAIEWDKDPAELIAVLVECGWLDLSDEHRVIVHDWADHMPQWVGGNLKRHNREPISNSTKQPTVQATKQPTKEPTMQVAVQPTVQATSLSSLTIPYHTTTSDSGMVSALEKAGERLTFLVGPDSRCREWCTLFPAYRMTGQDSIASIFPEAIEKIQSELGGCSEDVAYQHLRQRTMLYANSWRGKNKKLCWSAENWLARGHWKDPVEAWEDPDASPMPPKIRHRTAAEENAAFLAKTGGRRI